MGRKSTGTVRPTQDGKAWEAKYTLLGGKRGPWGELPGSAGLDRPAAEALAASYAPSVRASSAGDEETVAKYVDRWLADRKTRVVSIKDDTSRMRDHVLPELGTLGARSITRDDIERVRDKLDDKVKAGDLSWKTAQNVWTLLRKLGDDMANARNRELRVRSDNPAAGVKPPLRGKRKEKQFLFPSEFLKFLHHPDVPDAGR